MNTQMMQEESPKSPATVVDWKRVLVFVLLTLMMPLLLFLAAGRIDWWQAWIYATLSSLLSFTSRYMIFLKSPELINERFRFIQSEGIKNWDKHLVVWIAIIMPIAFEITAGLDKRFAWSAEGAVLIQFAAVFVFVLSFALVMWAMSANTFFSSVVRIQTERGHTVVTTGPYQFVRHPAYIGGVLIWLVTPIMLGSVWSFIPAGIICILYIVRTMLEDRTLQAELPGYQEYAQRVRYRLLPGVW